MSDYIITTDMTADLPQGYLKENDIDILSMPFTLDGKEYCRDTAMSIHDFYEAIRKGATPTTSQVDLDDAMKIFESHLEKGEDVLHLCFSSGISGSYDNLNIVRNELKEKYPDRKIIIVDTLAGVGGEGILVYRAVEMRKQGKSIEEVAAWVEDRKLTAYHYFIVDDLELLKKGGRLSKIEAALGTILGIKPVLALNSAGKITPLAKARGKKKAVSIMYDMVVEHFKKEYNDFILVGHADSEESAKEFGAKINEKFPDVSVKYCTVDYLVGSHVGPGALAVFFFGEKRPK